MKDFHPKPFGKYFLIEKLATGGMAEIYKAKTFGVDGFEKILAIKRILPHCAVDKEFIGMLVDEAKLSVLLSHTNIVQVYDLGKVGEDYFISMEFINGLNLREVLSRAKETEQKFSEDIVVYILSETCKGLDYAHSKKDNEGKALNIVHRDISPQNILLSFEGEVKIVDFGIAKAAMNISHTMAGILKGKISYMSPEQALGKPIDRKTDIFSAGLILYEMLTGEKLFVGETQFEVLKKIRTTRLNENSFPDSIPLALRKILAKALSYSIKDRYENAGDMQIDLTRYLYSTYIDFTPRKLSGLMRQLFAQEIERKTTTTAGEEIPIDSRTRSVMIESKAQENIVHRGSDEITGDTLDKQSTQTFIESFISGQDEDLGETSGLTRAETDLHEVSTPRAAPTSPPPKQSSTKAKTKAKKSRWWAYPIAALLLAAAGAGAYFKTDWFKAKPPPPVIHGVLQINSTPEGAKIFLNDAETEAVTPATLKDLPLEAPQKITLKKPKFKDFTRTLSLSDANPVVLNPTLEVIPVGTVKVVSTPPGAKIFLDGKDTGKVAPAVLEDLPLSQNFHIGLQLEKHRPIEKPVTIYSIEPLNFNEKLEEILYGPIRVTSSPSGARVYLDNKDTGLSTPATLAELEVGKNYTVRLARQGYREVVRSVELSGKQGAAVSEKLLKIDEKTPQEIAEQKLQELERQKELQRQKERKTKEEPPTQAVADTYLSLSSNPKGADVFINGVRKGNTPGRWKVAAASPLEITLSKSGFSSVTKVVTLRPGETRNLGTLNLGGGSSTTTSPISTTGGAGIIVIDSNPPGALVLLNGAPQKTTPVRIKGLRPSTSHTITVKKDGYQTWSTSFTVTGDGKSFMANLKKL